MVIIIEIEGSAMLNSYGQCSATMVSYVHTII
jgi:hypothetical protein